MPNANIDTAGNDYTCTGDASICVGGSASNKQTTCTHRFALCVTCNTDADGDVAIRLQSNGMVDHCWRSATVDNVAEYQNYDFTVKWNADVFG